MKKLKYVFWIILVAFFGLLIYQNLPFFTYTNSLKINLGVYAYQTPDMTNGAIIAAFVGIGVLIMLLFYFSSLYDGYRSKKIIKMLQKTNEERSAEMDELKKQVALLKGDLSPKSDQPSEAQETETETEPQT